MPNGQPQQQPTVIKTGGSSTGLIIGGIAVIAVAGVVGWYFYTGYKTEQDYVSAVQDYQNCVEQALAAGHTTAEIDTICWGYKQAVADLGQKLEQGFGYWVDKALNDLKDIGLIAIGLGAMYIFYLILNKWLKTHGGGGGTPTNPYHDVNKGSDPNECSYSTIADFVNHCVDDYGAPSYDHPQMNSIWASVDGMADWEKELLVGFFQEQGIDNPQEYINTGWDSLPTAAKIALAGILIAGLLIICTVSLGAATPAALPIAQAAILIAV